MRVYATRPSAWLTPVTLAAVHLQVDPDSIVGPFASETLNALATLGLNLAIAGALCASYALGNDPPLDCRPVAGILDAVTVAMWHPGCGRPSQ